MQIFQKRPHPDWNRNLSFNFQNKEETLLEMAGELINFNFSKSEEIQEQYDKLEKTLKFIQDKAAGKS